MKRRPSGSSRSCMPLATMTSGSTLNFVKSGRLSLPRNLSSCVAGASCSQFPSGETASCMGSWSRSSHNLLVSVSIPLETSLYIAFTNPPFLFPPDVINYYQTTMYGALGIVGKKALLVSGIYNIVGPVTSGNVSTRSDELDTNVL